MIIVRVASPDDASQLAALRFEFRSGLADVSEARDAFVTRCAQWMTEQLASGRWRAWVAERDREAVGQLWMHVIDKVPNPVGERARHAYVSNLYVVPGARGGVGTRLLEAALDYARVQEVDRVILWPTSRSRSLYLRYGFTPDGEVFERKL